MYTWAYDCGWLVGLQYLAGWLQFDGRSMSVGLGAAGDGREIRNRFLITVIRTTMGDVL